MITLYNAVSENGYINEADGSEDFISYDVWYDFIDLCGKYDTVALGKNSYFAIQDYEPKERKLFEILPIKKIIISRDKNFIPNEGYEVVRSVNEFSKLGKNILVSSGPALNDVLLKEKLIDKIILNHIPVNINGGLKQFSSEQPKMVLESEKNIKNKRVLQTYNVLK